MPRSSTAILFVVLAAFVLAACAGDPVEDSPASVTIFAAASLTSAFEELARQFKSQTPGAEVLLNLGGSQQLAQQLAFGAPADIFVSADRRQLDVVIESGRIQADNIRLLASNQLVILVAPQASHLILEAADLTRPGLKIALAAEEVPLGQYTRAYLRAAEASGEYPPGFSDRVLVNVATFEVNARAVLGKVLLGETDAGIVYASDAHSAEESAAVVIPIPMSLTPEIGYWVATIEGSHAASLSKAFLDFLFSDSGRRILEMNGLMAVGE